MAAKPEVVTRPRLPVVDPSVASLVVELTSTLREEVRVTVRLDGRVAVDERIPASGVNCSSDPVFSTGLDLAPGSTDVVVSTDHGQRKRLTLDVTRERSWLVVSIQDGFPMYVQQWTTEPQYG